MRRFSATIEGVTPILMNRYVEEPEVVASIGAKPRDKTKEDAWRREEGTLRLYQNGHGPYLPSRNIRSAMIQGADAAAIRHKHGRTQRALGPFLRRGLTVEPLELLFAVDKWAKNGKPASEEWQLHGEPVRVPPRTGALVMKYWPRLDKWMLGFTLAVFDDSLEEEAELKASLESAGIFCGLGTGRPDYGKFKLTSWAELPD